MVVGSSWLEGPAEELDARVVDARYLTSGFGGDSKITQDEVAR